MWTGVAEQNSLESSIRYGILCQPLQSVHNGKSRQFVTFVRQRLLENLRRLSLRMRVVRVVIAKGVLIVEVHLVLGPLNHRELLGVRNAGDLLRRLDERFRLLIA